MAHGPDLTCQALCLLGDFIDIIPLSWFPEFLMRIVLIFIIIFLYTMFPLLPQASLMIPYLEFSRF